MNKEGKPILGVQSKISLAPRKQTFILQFLATPSEQGELILDERHVIANDVEEAIREAVAIPWPARVHSFRLIDLDGQEVFHRHTLDGRGAR